MNLEETKNLVKNLLENLGLDPNQEGLRATPSRVAKSLKFLTKGYSEDPRETLGAGVFASPTEEMVVVRDIDFFSMCEHHMLPFFGKVHVAYLPQKKIIGLSKMARLVEVYSRRLQVQERMTEEIAHTLQDLLNPRGVAVVVEAQHLCMMMRGVQKINSKATTSSVLGAFLDQPATRSEFMNLIHRNGC
jgi:GTP cyclohydrolase I